MMDYRKNYPFNSFFYSVYSMAIPVVEFLSLSVKDEFDSLFLNFVFCTPCCVPKPTHVFKTRIAERSIKLDCNIPHFLTDF